MVPILFYVYLILVGLWLLMSLVVFIFTIRHHPLSVTSWVVVLLYVLIASQIFTVTFTALGRYIPLRTLLQF